MRGKGKCRFIGGDGGERVFLERKKRNRSKIPNPKENNGRGDMGDTRDPIPRNSEARKTTEGNRK